MNEILNNERKEMQFKTIIRHAIADYLEGETPVPPDVWTEISYELTEKIYDSLREWMAGNKTN